MALHHEERPTRVQRTTAVGHNDQRRRRVWRPTLGSSRWKVQVGCTGAPLGASALLKTWSTG